MLTLENPTGRLLAVRAGTPLTTDEVEQAMSVLRGPRVGVAPQWIAASDLRTLRVLPPWAQERTGELFGEGAQGILRSAILVAEDNAILRMQLERLLHASGVQNRQVFAEPGAAVRWLRALLTGAEAAALEQFLERTRPPSRPPAFGLGLI